LSLISLNYKKIFPIRKSTTQKEAQFDDMETVVKIISIVATYIFLVENESLLNKKFINHKETNSKTCTTYCLYHDVYPNFNWPNLTF